MKTSFADKDIVPAPPPTSTPWGPGESKRTKRFKDVKANPPRSLYQWKRTSGVESRRAEQRSRSRVLFRGTRTQAQIPKGVQDWFDDLCDLRRVPFEYLVPDERLLPAESLRFFWVDARWVQCLLDGAYSIGRVTEGDKKREMHRSVDSPVGAGDRLITGLLLRSAVVSGWRRRPPSGDDLDGEPILVGLPSPGGRGESGATRCLF